MDAQPPEPNMPTGFVPASENAFRTLAARPHVSSRRRVLLLQGPVGPFFARLQDHLSDHGLDTWHVAFHRGDKVFGNRDRTLTFRGDPAAWEDWLGQILAFGGFDTIILFGSERPAHVIARRVAARTNVTIISLEEGYIRPGYISVEQGGNNASSPLAGKILANPTIPPQDLPPVAGYRSLNQLILYGAIYYTVRGLSTFGRDRQLFHKQTHLLPEAFCWTRNFLRRLTGGERNFSKIQQLLEHWDRAFYLVPLQVDKDANLTRFANGWNSTRLVSETIRSFERHAPRNSRLVFKIHPMERGHNRLSPHIRKTASAMGVADRVDVIDTGSLGLLTRHSAGMITINSTSAFSAIFHGVPLMVLGQAIYANPQLAMTTPRFDDFWTSKHVASPELRRAYIDWIKENALKPGDYYCNDGIAVAVQSVRDKLHELDNAMIEDIPLKVAS